MQKVRLSHSSMNRYMQCPTSWKNHYVEGYRPTEISSALVFGSAIGKVFEYILTPKIEGKEHLSDTDFFDYEWTHQYVNDELTNIKEYKEIAYSKYDTDLDLLTKEEIDSANGDAKVLAWYSLRAKGHLMIECFKREMLPKIKKVYSTEELIELTNGDGDSSIGYADAVLDIEGYNSPIVLDFKTAAREYEQDSVAKSIQLSQYIHVLGDKYNTRLAGYCVFLKSINKNKTKICAKCGYNGTGASHKTCNNEIGGKRCNGDWNIKLNASCSMQLIIDEIPHETEEFVVGNIENIAASIKTGIFTRNVNSCYDNGFGRPCEFQKLCWTGKKDGLVKVEKKEKA